MCVSIPSVVFCFITDYFCYSQRLFLSLIFTPQGGEMVESFCNCPSISHINLSEALEQWWHATQKMEVFIYVRRSVGGRACRPSLSPTGLWHQRRASGLNKILLRIQYFSYHYDPADEFHSDNIIILWGVHLNCFVSVCQLFVAVPQLLHYI